MAGHHYDDIMAHHLDDIISYLMQAYGPELMMGAI